MFVRHGSFSSLASVIVVSKAKAYPTVKHHTDVPLKGRILALPTNIRPVANVIKLFSTQLRHYGRNLSRNHTEICCLWHKLRLKIFYNIGYGL